MAIDPDIPSRWRLEDLLVKQPGLRIVPGSTNFVLAGKLLVDAQMPGKSWIKDSYQVEIQFPAKFPEQIPFVFETSGRIPQSYHRLANGSLCLGSETRLRLLLAGGISVVGFVELCVVPYLYRFSYLERYGEAPFGDLAHGPDGIREDLKSLFEINSDFMVLPFVRLASMKKRYANKKACPCGGRLRLGCCHNRVVNRLRARLGRYWFRVLEQQLMGAVPTRSLQRIHSTDSAARRPVDMTVSVARTTASSEIQKIGGEIVEQLSRRSPLGLNGDVNASCI